MIARATAMACMCLAITWLGLSPARAHGEQAVQVTLCQLLADPGRYDHALIEVSGDVGHGFEDFSMHATGCAEPSRSMGLWLEYGGTNASGTMYCCGVTAQRSRPEALIIDGVTTKLRDDSMFQRFDQVIQRRPYAKAKATLIGRFFAGKPQRLLENEWGGYGHMGMFTLLVIEQVRAVAALPVRH